MWNTGILALSRDWVLVITDYVGAAFGGIGMLKRVGFLGPSRAGAVAVVDSCGCLRCVISPGERWGRGGGRWERDVWTESARAQRNTGLCYLFHLRYFERKGSAAVQERSERRSSTPSSRQLCSGPLLPPGGDRDLRSLCLCPTFSDQRWSV